MRSQNWAELEVITARISALKSLHFAAEREQDQQLVEMLGAELDAVKRARAQLILRITKQISNQVSRAA